MTRITRIPLTVTPQAVTWIDDMDLIMLLQQGGCHEVFHGAMLSAQDSQGQPLSAQWLPSATRSAVRGHQRGTLIMAPTNGARVHVLASAAVAQAEPKHEVEIKKGADVLEVTIAGHPFFTYRYNTKDPELQRPYFHPLIGPSGQTITQLGEVPGQKIKHFHHTALYIAHQNFTAQGEPNCDNWQIGRPNSSKIEHSQFDGIQSGPLAGRFIERLHWLNVKGDKVLLAETRTVTIPKRPADRRVIDVDIVLTAKALPVTLNRTPYHLLALRVLDALLPAKGGAITNAEGQKNPKDGTPSKWIDISGKLDGEEQGAALFDHPKNFRHPTPCLQFAGQTIGLSPTHREPYTIEPGKSLSLKYRVLVHAGNAETGKVAEEYAEFAQPKGGARIGVPERIAI
ncbi:MAG: PmoA family protein [Gemmataceae bacterium]